VVRGPGEYEMAGVLITGIRTYHDNQRGARQGTNTAFIIEAETLRLCHLGDLGHLPTPEQVEAMGGIDILLVPVGGGNTLDATAAAETVSLLEPKLVIPMHYATPATTRNLDPLDRFLKEIGASPDLTAQPRLSVSHGSLPHETQVAVLDYKR
jgi:L-ascorbate metabolism protein UlaG (beta-lactamase superfamily)